MGRYVANTFLTGNINIYKHMTVLKDFVEFKNCISYKDPSPYLLAGKICISVRKYLTANEKY